MGTLNTTLGQLVNSWVSVNKLMECELPAHASLRLARFVRVALPEWEQFEQKRQELIKRYGEAGANGDLVVTPEHMPEFTRQLNKLLAEPLELPHPRLKDSDILDVKGLSSYHFFGLVWLFDDGQQEES